MKYTLLEKLAIVKVLDEMILADKIEDPKEREYLNNVATELQITPEFTIESRQLRNTECLDILRRMEPEKKDQFTQMLREITEADGHTDPSEVNMMIGIFESLGLNEQDEVPVYNVPDINYLLFTPSHLYTYDKDYSGNRNLLPDSSNIKIESTPTDGKNYFVTIFKQSENYHLWGVEVIYPTLSMQLIDFNEDSIILESAEARQKLELFYNGIDIQKIRFQDFKSGIFYEFIN